jgi:hypothetical protein
LWTGSTKCEGRYAGNRMPPTPNARRIVASNSVAPGTVALRRGGKIVWTGALSAPIEDAEYDEVLLNPADYQRMVEALGGFDPFK